MSEPGTRAPNADDASVLPAFDAGSLQEGVDQARNDIEAISASCSGILGS